MSRWRDEALSRVRLRLGGHDEYAAHLRDALAFYQHRIRRVLDEDRPRLEPFDFATACEAGAYATEVPAEVFRGLRLEGEGLGGRLTPLTDSAWHRVGLGSQGDERTLIVLARRAAHEGVHHLLDIGRVRRAIRQQLASGECS